MKTYRVEGMIEIPQLYFTRLNLLLCLLRCQPCELVSVLACGYGIVTIIFVKSDLALVIYKGNDRVIGLDSLN